MALKIHRNIRNLLGKRFGRLIVISLTKKRSKYRNGVIWRCKCDCGKIKDIRGDCLVTGDTKSCGCYRKDFLTFYQRLEKGISGFNSLYDRYKQSARNRKIRFSLSKKIFKKITQEKCSYCGKKPSQIAKRKCKYLNSTRWGIYIYNGIDRINNKIGYTKNNCQACCKQCQTMKWTYSEKEFINQVKKIIKWYRNRKE